MTRREIERTSCEAPGARADESPTYLERARWLERLRELSTGPGGGAAREGHRLAADGPPAGGAPSTPRRPG